MIGWQVRKLIEVYRSVFSLSGFFFARLPLDRTNETLLWHDWQGFIIMFFNLALTVPQQ